MADPARDWTEDPGPDQRRLTPIDVFAPRSLDEQVRKVADGRRHLQSLNAVLDEKRRAFEEANADLATQIERAKRQVRDGETVLKTMALTEHRETGELTVAPGVKIRRVLQVDYDAMDAIEWCKAHDEAAGCLKLDTVKFGSLAKALSLPFVRKETVSQVTLSRDLDAELKGAAA